MEHKEKYVLPFNTKIKFISIVIILFVVLSFNAFVNGIKEDNVELIIESIIFILLFLSWFIIIFHRGLKLKKDRIILPSDYMRFSKIKCEEKYQDIKRIDYIAKKEEGLHAKNIYGKDVNTLVIMNKQGQKHLFSLQDYSKKQIKYIIEEISRRANIKD